MRLREPEFYLPMMDKLLESTKYAANWTPRIESKTNRHPNCDGTPWGWYEIWPLRITVGYWSGKHKDDLKGIDIKDWNRRAAEFWNTRKESK